MSHVPATSTFDLIVTIVMVIGVVGWLVWMYVKGVPPEKSSSLLRSFSGGRTRGRNRF